MVTIVIRRTEEPRVIQMTQLDVAKQIASVNDSEIILADSWLEGLKKVRTPYVSLIEPDAVFSANYYSSNVGLIKKAHTLVKSNPNQPMGGGGYQKLAMISSCLGVRTFGNRTYNYEIDKPKDIIPGKGCCVQAIHTKAQNKLYHVQVGFVPGAIIRMSAIKDIIEDELWLSDDLVKLSTALSFYLWDTGRRIEVNPNTTYVSLNEGLELSPIFETFVPEKVKGIFHQEGIGWAL